MQNKRDYNNTHTTRTLTAEAGRAHAQAAGGVVVVLWPVVRAPSHATVCTSKRSTPTWPEVVVW